MPEITTKLCEVCHVAFTPDPRVGCRQRVCKQLSCQKNRKRRSQQNWLLKNPGYFKGRYPELKAQILQRRRMKKQSGRPALFRKPKRPTCIQDEIISCYYNMLSDIMKNMGIQDKITSKITASNQRHGQQIQIVYKTSEAMFL